MLSDRYQNDLKCIEGSCVKGPSNHITNEQMQISRLVSRQISRDMQISRLVSEQFRKLINRYKRISYSLDIMRQTACLVVNPIIVDGYALLFNCTTAVRASDSMTASS